MSSFSPHSEARLLFFSLEDDYCESLSRLFQPFELWARNWTAGLVGWPRRCHNWFGILRQIVRVARVGSRFDTSTTSIIRIISTRLIRISVSHARWKWWDSVWCTWLWLQSLSKSFCELKSFFKNRLTSEFCTIGPCLFYDFILSILSFGSYVIFINYVDTVHV